MTRLMLDALADALCLAMMLRLRGRPVRPGRVSAAAVLGAVSAVCVRKMGLTRMGDLLIGLPLAAAMAFVADPAGTSRQPVRAAASWLAMSGFLGGTVLALCGAAGSLVWGWALGAAAASALFAHVVRANRARGDARTAKVVCRHRGKTAAFEAMIDSGNCLRDYLTHWPVIVLPQAQGERLFQLEGAVLRPIFADTAGGRQMMGCFVPDMLQIKADGRTRIVQAVLALSPGLSGHAPALLPASLLDIQQPDE